LFQGQGHIVLLWYKYIFASKNSFNKKIDLPDTYCLFVVVFIIILRYEQKLTFNVKDIPK